MSSVWVSKVKLDSRLIKPLSSDLTAGVDLLDYWRGDPSKEPTGPWPCPTQIWVDQDYEGAIGKLPDLFMAESVWIVSRRLAGVLELVDLGNGRLEPVAAFDKDRQTPLPGEYFSWTFPNVKRAFLPDQSTNLRNFVRGVFTTRALIADGDLACSRNALAGPDVWIDPCLYGSIFLSDGLMAALAETGCRSSSTDRPA
jgi:hypothetical protein